MKLLVRPEHLWQSTQSPLNFGDLLFKQPGPLLCVENRRDRVPMRHVSDGRISYVDCLFFGIALSKRLLHAKRMTRLTSEKALVRPPVCRADVESGASP